MRTWNRTCSKLRISELHQLVVGVACYGMLLKLHTQDTDFKETREVYTFKYDTRTRKVNNSISKKLHAQHHWKNKNRALTQLQPTSSTTENSTAANVVDAIMILTFHWTLKVTLKNQTLKFDARTHKATRHSFLPLKKQKTKTQLQPTSSVPVVFSLHRA